jgi:hypothetical protein
MTASGDAINAALSGEATCGTCEERLASYEGSGWEISAGSPPGMWSAWQISGDGRHRHYVVEPTAGQLAGKLAEITAESP